MKMHPFQGLIPLEEALELLEAKVRPLEATEMVGLDRAHGRVLARDIVAAMEVPPFDRAAMDGYAVVALDTTGANEFQPVSVELVEVVHAGQVPTREVSSGQCTQVATGAMMPAGSDGVVMVEQTREQVDGQTTRIKIMRPIYAGQNLSNKGSDIQAGDLVLKAGWVLNPSRIGVLASLGQREVSVYARPRVALLSTGSEVVPVDQPLKPGQIYDSNSYTLEALTRRLGARVTRQPILPDELTGYVQRLRELVRDHDLLVVSGGSSVGERDLLVSAVEKLGQVHFHGVAVRPGKPVLWATIDGTPLLGLPGYPTSCLVTGHIFLTPLLRLLGHHPTAPARVVQATLSRRINSVYGRTQFHTVKLTEDPEAETGLTAEPVFKGSGALTSLSTADGLMVIPSERDLVEQGTLVDIHLW